MLRYIDVQTQTPRQSINQSIKNLKQKGCLATNLAKDGSAR